MKSLVIAEKPSVARDIARFLSAGKILTAPLKDRTWLPGAGPSGDRLTLRITIRSIRSGRWRTSMMPEVFKLEVIKQTKAVPCKPRFTGDGDIIIATDAGRKESCGPADSEKDRVQPIRRLWISSVTIRLSGGFANLKDGREYNNLYDCSHVQGRGRTGWWASNATRP